MSLSFEARQRLGAFTLDAAFTAGRGVTALFGRSGSGKTSVIRLIAGLARPDDGRIVFDGDSLADRARKRHVPAHKRRFGCVFQEALLFPHLTVAQNLHYGRWFASREVAAVDEARVVEMLGIGPLLQRRPAKLSGGERQRVAIGRALLAAPRLLLMDEPLASLDEARKAEIIPFLERLRGEAGIPILYVSHAVSEVARLADRLVILEDGRVSAEGPAAELLPRLAMAGDRFEHPQAGAVLSGVIESFDQGHGLACVGVSAMSLLVPASSGAPGRPVRVLIPARDVMLATVRPQGLSALNIFEGRIVAIAAVDAGMVTVEVDCGGAIVLARITALSCERLGLAPDRPVFAIVKSAALNPF